MADEALLNKIQDLSDLELATLLCLTNKEHCIIDTHPGALDETVSELRLVSSAETVHVPGTNFSNRSLPEFLVSPML